MRTEDLSAQREVQESLKLSFIIEIVHTGTPEKNSIKEIKIIMRIDLDNRRINIHMILV